LTQKFNGTLGKCYGGLLNGGSIYSTCHHDGSLFVTVIMMSTFCGRRARALAERSWNGIWLRRRLFTVLTVAIANLSHGPTRSGELFGERDLVLTNCSDRSSSVRRSSSRSCPSLAMAGQPLSLVVIRLPYRKENPKERVRSHRDSIPTGHRTGSRVRVQNFLRVNHRELLQPQTVQAVTARNPPGASRDLAITTDAHGRGADDVLDGNDEHRLRSLVEAPWRSLPRSC
jgi:hypothetical protein